MKMRKVLLFIVLMSLMTLNVSAEELPGINCKGPTSVNGLIEGQTYTIEAPIGLSSPIAWEVSYPSYPNIDTGLFVSPFSNAVNCLVNFTPLIDGNFTLTATEQNAPQNTRVVIVEVLDSLDTLHYGHQCYAVNTANCGDIAAYGDVAAADSMSSNDLFVYGNTLVVGYLEVGTQNQVHIDPYRVTLPETYINGELMVSDNLVLLDNSYILNSLEMPVLIQDDLEISGNIYAGDDDDVVDIVDDVDMEGNLDVSGSTSLHNVESIHGTSPITVDANLDISGDLSVGGGITLGGEYRDQWIDDDKVGVENLVKNPGFEFASGFWELDENSGDGSSLHLSSHALSGDFSAKLVSNNNEAFIWGEPIYITDNVDSITASINYHLQATGPDRDAELHILTYPNSYDGTYYNEGQGHHYVDHFISGTSTDWDLLNLSVENLDTDNIVAYRIRLDANSIGTVAFFDNAQVEYGTFANKYRPRYLDFEGNAEFNSVDTMGDLYTEGVLSALGSTSVLGNLLVGGTANVEGFLDVNGEVNVDGNIVAAEPDSRIMGAIYLRKNVCDSANQKVYADGSDFIVDLGEPESCGANQPCEHGDDCISGSCNGGTCDPLDNG